MSDIAERIVADIRALSPFDPREDEIADLDAAYRIQRDVTRALREGHAGRRIAGYKIAFNRQSSMDYYRLQEPCHAPLFSDQIYETGVELPVASFRDLVIEPEIALRLRAGLTGRETLSEVADAIDAWLPAIEIMDARGAFPRDPSAAAAVAQRVHNEGAVLGMASVGPFDMADIVVSVKIEGETVGSAAANAPQAPLEAVHWLAQRLARDGLTLDAGMVVLTGAHLPGKAIAGTGRVEVELAPLGRVTMDLV